MAGPNLKKVKEPKKRKQRKEKVIAEEASATREYAEIERGQKEVVQEEDVNKDLSKKEQERLKLTQKEEADIKRYINNLKASKGAMLKGNEDATFKFCGAALKNLLTVFSEERLKFQKTQLAKLDINRELALSQMEEAEDIRMFRETAQRRKLVKSR